MAILTQRRPKDEDLGMFFSEQYGTKISYEYNCFEVYNLNDEELLQSDNPFDLIFHAVKNTINLKGKNAEERKLSELLMLVRLLASKGWNEDDRRDIFTFITRAVNLKDLELKKEFIEKVEEDENMRELTFVEQYFIDKAANEAMVAGRLKGRRENQFETARRLRNMGMNDADIHQATRLSLEEISSL